MYVMSDLLQYAKIDSYIMEHTHRSDIPSFFPYLIGRSKSKVLPTFKGKTLYKGTNARSRTSGSHLGGLSTIEEDKDSGQIARPS